MTTVWIFNFRHCFIYKHHFCLEGLLSCFAIVLLLIGMISMRCLLESVDYKFEFEKDWSCLFAYDFVKTVVSENLMRTHVIIHNKSPTQSLRQMPKQQIFSLNWRNPMKLLALKRIRRKVQNWRHQELSARLLIGFYSWPMGTERFIQSESQKYFWTLYLKMVKGNDLCRRD